MFNRLKKLKINQKTEKDKPGVQNNSIRGLLQSEKLPLIILDGFWYEIKELVQTDQIIDDEEKLNQLVQEKGRLTTESLKYDKAKQNLVFKVLEISEEIQYDQDDEKLHELEKSRQAILEVNKIIEQNEKRLDELEILIEATNRKIVEEVVAKSYGQIEEYRRNKERLEREIDELRQQVVLKTEEKKTYDKQFGSLYNYLHKIIGYQYINKVDKQLGEK